MRGQLQNVIWWIVGLIALGVLIAAFLLPIGGILGGFFELPIFDDTTNNELQGTVGSESGSANGESQGTASSASSGSSEQTVCTNDGPYCNNIEPGRHWDGSCYECVPLEGRTTCRFTMANLPATKEECLS